MRDETTERDICRKEVWARPWLKNSAPPLFSERPTVDGGLEQDLLSLIVARSPSKICARTPS